MSIYRTSFNIHIKENRLSTGSDIAGFEIVNDYITIAQNQRLYANKQLKYVYPRLGHLPQTAMSTYDGSNLYDCYFTEGNRFWIIRNYWTKLSKIRKYDLKAQVQIGNDKSLSPEKIQEHLKIVSMVTEHPVS